MQSQSRCDPRNCRVTEIRIKPIVPAVHNKPRLPNPKQRNLDGRQLQEYQTNRISLERIEGELDCGE